MRTLLCAGLAFVSVVTHPAAQSGARGGEWRWHGGDPGSTKYAPLDQINKDNVSTLRIAWRRPAVDPRSGRGAPDSSSRTTSAPRR